MAQAAPRDQELEFVYQWSAKVVDVLNSPQHPDRLLSPAFHTQHGDFRLEWRLGVNEESNSYHIHPLLAGPGITYESINATWSLSMEDNAVVTTVSKFRPHAWNIHYISLQKQEIEAKAVDGMITFHFHLKISEADFTRFGINVNKSGRVVEVLPGQEDKRQSVGLSFNLFNKIVTEKKVGDEDPKQPDADIHQKKLDFQIHTSNGYVIWCHSLVLVSGNEKLATLIGAGLKETEKSTLKVKFGSEVMMEVLHVVYREVVLGKFQDLDIHEILDAANDYNLPKLKKACEERLLKMCEELDGETGAQVLVLGDRYGMARVKREALDWASDYPGKIWRSDAGKEMKEDLWLEILDATETKLQNKKKQRAMVEEAEQS